jgi:2-polyprenyl-3-methyl-5-hydroxy-6-metoxy-1,4-benzoquinol methylase
MKDEQGVKDFFSDYAEDFDSIYGDGKPRNLFNRITDKLFRQSMYERYKRTIDFLTNSDVKTVLDVGCGSGRYSLDLAKNGMIVTGVDLAQKMLNIAQSNSQKAGFENNTYIVGSYFDVKIDKKHDAAILMGLFDYISNPEELFSKLKKDTGKYILASFPKPGGILGWQRKIRYNMRNCQLFYYSKESLEELMSASDISNYEIQDNHREYFLIAKLG